MSHPFVSAILALPHLHLPTSQKTNDVDLWISQCQRNMAAIAQLGERQTEDLKVPGSIPGLGIISLHHITLPRYQSSGDPKRSPSCDPIEILLSYVAWQQSRCKN